jgi:uncharacterized protein GlcG (DUF336 family)
MRRVANSAPAAWKTGNRCYGSGLTLQTARKMLAAAEKEAGRQGVPMVIAIADSGGNLLAFERMDQAILVSVQIAIDKAYTSVFGKQSTARFGADYKAGSLVPLFFHERWITFPGGFPLIKDGVILGGIGVSGGIGEDVFVAKAALKAGGFDTAEADEIIESQIKASKPG